MIWHFKILCKYARLTFAQTLVALCMSLNFTAAAEAEFPQPSLSLHIVHRTETNAFLVAILRNEVEKEIVIDGRTGFSCQYRVWTEAFLPVMTREIISKALHQPASERIVTVKPGEVVSNLFSITFPSLPVFRLEARSVYSTSLRAQDMQDFPLWTGSLTSAWIRVISKNQGESKPALDRAKQNL